GVYGSAPKRDLLDGWLRRCGTKRPDQDSGCDGSGTDTRQEPVGRWLRDHADFVLNRCFDDRWEGMPVLRRWSGAVVFDRRDETIADAGEGFHILRVIGGIAQRQPQPVRGGVETAFEVDVIVPPESLLQFFSGDHLSRALQ